MQKIKSPIVQPFLAAGSLHKGPVDADLLSCYLGTVQVVNCRLSFLVRIILNKGVTLPQTTLYH